MRYPIRAAWLSWLLVAAALGCGQAALQEEAIQWKTDASGLQQVEGVPLAGIQYDYP